jgi:hypothetical protein
MEERVRRVAAERLVEAEARRDLAHGARRGAEPPGEQFATRRLARPYLPVRLGWSLFAFVWTEFGSSSGSTVSTVGPELS